MTLASARASLLASTFLLLAAACGGGATPTPDAYGESGAVPIEAAAATVELRDNRFQPQGIRIEPGTTVTWINRDPVVHNVRQIQSKFLSADVMQENDQFAFVFTEPGTYRYQCTFHHPLMNGVVIVEEG